MLSREAARRVLESRGIPIREQDEFLAALGFDEQPDPRLAKLETWCQHRGDEIPPTPNPAYCDVRRETLDWLPGNQGEHPIKSERPGPSEDI
jgi:hypothetical protein